MTKILKLVFAIWIVICALCIPNAMASAAQSRLWNLQDADILSVINEVSQETGKNFVVDPRVTGKISLISSKPIKPDELYNVFLSVLELLGYSAIPTGDVVKIVPNMESGEFATHIATNESPGHGDEVVVRVIPLDYIQANQVIPMIRPLLPQWSNVTSYAPGNVLILLGRASNLERIMAIIRHVDQAAMSSGDIDIIPLHQASASQVATVLSNLQSAGRAQGETTSPVSIAADERSNSILLSGNKAARERTKLLISHLDISTTGADDTTQVVYLRYLQAKTIAPILNKIAQNMLGHKDNSAAATPTAGSTANSVKSKDSDDQPNIQAEPSTNALIITAPAAMMRNLNAIITKLDMRPAQVLVEGVIVEIDQDDLKNLGIQWGAKNLSTATGVGFPQLGAGVVGIIPGQQIQAVLSVLQNKTGVNILSTPSIVVLDNHKAMLQIGKDVPFTNGSYASTAGSTTATPFNTTTYKKVALQLTVMPQINLGTAVRLSVDLKNDSLQNPDNPGPDPITNTSQIRNSVIINSTDILVLGGLISNNITDSTQKVPYLGDIPIIGNLFKHQTRKLEKKNLMVFIKPTILHNPEDGNAITNTKYNVTRNAQTEWPVDLSNPGDQKRQNILPLWKNNTVLPKPFDSNG